MNALASARAIIRAPLGKRERTWQDRYTLAFGIVVLGAVAAEPLSRVWNRIVAPAATTDPATIGTGLALVVLAYTGVIALARLVGPIAVSPADAAWLVPSPLTRRAVLRPAALRLLVASIVAGAVLGVTVLAVLGVPDLATLRVAGAVLIAVAACVGGAALAVLAQRGDPESNWLGVALAALATLAIVAGLAAASGAALPGARCSPRSPDPGERARRRRRGGLSRRDRPRRTGVAGVVRLPSRAVIASSARVGQATGAIVTLDPGLLTWIAEDNHWRARRLRSRPWPRLPAPLALAWAEARRLGRRPARLAALLAAAAFPALAAVAAGGITPPVAVALLAGALTAAASATAVARRDSGNPTLIRMTGVSRQAARAVRAIPPALFAAGWLAAALGALGLVGPGVAAGASWWAFAPLCAPPIAVAALRMAGRGPIDQSLPVLDTPGGPVPLGPLFWGFTGIDVAVLGCAPALAALLLQPGQTAGFLTAQAVATVLTVGGFLLRGRGT
ncbi:DUF6297 family protein [Microtetraspora malaysiensis]|uniref:DUF6297 family protein n=1 Tax=Microtetraspora malaysiensis TaxID=161358 RepID=UPI003D8AD684